MRVFLRVLDRVVDGAMFLSVIAITAMMVHVTLELLVRWALHTSLDAVPEISEYYYMTALTFFALAYVTRGDGHISATFFTESMTPRARSILEGSILIALCAYMVLLTWQIAVEAVAMTAINEVHQSARGYVPKWPGRWFLTAGSALMALYALVLGIRKLMGLGGADVPRTTNAIAQD